MKIKIVLTEIFFTLHIYQYININRWILSDHHLMYCSNVVRAFETTNPGSEMTHSPI